MGSCEMGNHHLLLWLEAPLQSWGQRSRWDVRDTGDEPTKSGVVGLLGCALGYPVGDSRLEQLDQVLQMGVRVDKPGYRIVDFQTISGVMRTAEGGRKGTPDKPNTIVSPRAYLQDAAFLVALAGPIEVLHACDEALQAPKWPIYLGRKSCPPSAPVRIGMIDGYLDFKDVFEQHPWCNGYAWHATASGPTELRCVVEDPSGELIRHDTIKAAPARLYHNRRVTEFVVAPKFSFAADN